MRELSTTLCRGVARQVIASMPLQARMDGRKDLNPSPLLSPRCVDHSRRRRLGPPPPPIPFPCCSCSPAFFLPYRLPLWAPSLVFVAHRRRPSLPPRLASPFPFYLAFWQPRCPPCIGGGGALFVRYLECHLRIYA